MTLNKQALRDAIEKCRKAGDANNIPFEIMAHVNEATVKAIKDSALMEFHSIATPRIVLALLDELEAAEKRIAELLKSAEISLEYAAGLENQIESAELRIAEFERKEHHGDRQSVIDALAASGETWSDIEEYMQRWDEARAAGIKIKGE